MPDSESGAKHKHKARKPIKLPKLKMPNIFG